MKTNRLHVLLLSAWLFVGCAAGEGGGPVKNLVEGDTAGGSAGSDAGAAVDGGTGDVVALADIESNDGAEGTDGATGGSEGTDGTDDTDSTDSTDGTSGTDGVEGTDGTSETDSTDGTDSGSGTDGTDGSNGGSGTDGTDASVAWTMILLPDTQYYAESWPEVFDAQTEWIAAQAAARNIQVVLHEGDVTNKNTDLQWARARGAMDTLVDAGIPFVIAPGNHDYGPGGNASNRDTLLNEYFGPADYAASESVLLYEAGAIDNSVHLLTLGGRPSMVVALEFAPRDDVVAWADDIVGAHPDRDVYLVTHVYMHYQEQRYDWAKYGDSQQWSPYAYGVASSTAGVNDGEQLWQKLAARHANVRCVFNGHVLGDGTGYLVSKGNEGNVVHQMLANYQKGVEPALPSGGGGYLRILTFQPDGQVTVETYSPVLDHWMDDDDQSFAFTFDPSDYGILAECSPGRVATCPCPGGLAGVRQCTTAAEFGACVCENGSDYPTIVIEDDPDNSTLDPCDTGTYKSPGADIDAARLLTDTGVQLATLSGCALSGVSACGSTASDPSEAHGAPDAPGTEAGGGYVSLNGGQLTCGWTGMTSVQKGQGQVIEIHEIGSSVENYRFELCGGSSGCSAITGYGTGVQLIPVDIAF